MTVTRSSTKRTDVAQTSSDVVIGASVDGLLDSLEHPELTITPSNNSAPSSSVMPASVGLNEPSAISAAVFLRQTAQTALEIANQPKPIEAVSTADLIRHTSFKKNSKCIIRIVPSGTLGKVRDASGVERSAKDAALFFDRFSLQSTVEEDNERFQLFEGLEGETLFLFNRRPRIWTFPGVVLNGTRPTVPPAFDQPGNEILKQRFIERLNMDFADELIRKYEQFYRGTQAIKLRMRCYISYENVIIECTLVGMTASRNAQIPGAVNVSLTVVVHDRSWMGDGITLTEDETLTALLAVQEQKDFLQQDVPPRAIVEAATSIDQLNAKAKDEADAVIAAQEKVSDLEKQVNAASDAVLQAQKDADTSQFRFDNSSQLLAQIQDDIDHGGGHYTQADFEMISQQASEAAEDLDTAVSNRDEANSILNSRVDEINAAREEADAAVRAQEATEAQLKNHPDGDGTTSLTIVNYTATLSTDANGHRIYTVTDEDGNVLSQEDVTGTPLGAEPDFVEHGSETNLS
jgi:hypothetical protein